MEKSESIKNLAVAFVAAQAEMGKAKKSSTNPHYRSKYADLEEIIDTVKEPFANHGLSFIQLPGEAGSLTTILMHMSGEFIAHTATTPLRKQDPQGVGDAITYLRRYSLAALAGMAQQDDDGNSHIGDNNDAPPFPDTDVHYDDEDPGMNQKLPQRTASQAGGFSYKPPYEEKDAIKAAGARWNKETKTWDSPRRLPSFDQYLVS